MSSTPLKRATLITLGLGEAGQKILYQVEKLAQRLGIIDPVKNPEKEKLKIIPIRLLYETINDNTQNNEDNKKGEALRYLLSKLKHSENNIDNIDKTFIRPSKLRIEPSKVIVENLAKLINELDPVVSTRYGFSMIRIDLDEQTLMKVGIAIYDEGLPVPPGISIASRESEIYDHVLGEVVPLQPTGGSGGRSTIVFQLLRRTENSIILDLLGIPINIKAPQVSVLKSALPSYRSFLLMHGLVGTGAGAAAAILETLREIGQKDVLSSRFKMAFTIIPSAEEAHIGKLDPHKWIKIFQWDVTKLLEFINDGLLDTTFIVDLDFAVLQYKKNKNIIKKKYDTIKIVNRFINDILNSKLNLYRRNELRRYTGLTASTLLVEYEKVDALIAYSLEPILCVHGPRGVRFGAGGSSVDEMELKDMMKGFVAVPMVSSMDVFNVYLDVARSSVEEEGKDIGEEALAALVLPVLHGLLAPMLRDMAEKFIVVVSANALKSLEEKIGYLPTTSDIAALFREVFTTKSYVKILVSDTNVATSVVAYALVDPVKYLNHVVIAKGWS